MPSYDSPPATRAVENASRIIVCPGSFEISGSAASLGPSMADKAAPPIAPLAVALVFRFMISLTAGATSACGVGECAAASHSVACITHHTAHPLAQRLSLKRSTQNVST
eukprot:373680-Rhodomonas_salina.1